HTGAFLPVGFQRPIQRLRVIQRLRDVPGCVPAGRHRSSRRGRASRGRALTEDIGGLVLEYAQKYLPTILISFMQAGWRCRSGGTSSVHMIYHVNARAVASRRFWMNFDFATAV